MVIETRNLTKIYSNNKGCMDITLSVGKGEIFALLGPNGAGKSTFIKTLVGLLFKTSGDAMLLGKPLGSIEVRSRIGYLPENFKFQEWMTGADLLSFHSSLYGIDRKFSKSRIDEVLEIVKLKGNENYKIGTYSKGMQQRIGIASAILSDPDLIFLDEPTSALDPIGRKDVREIMLNLKSMGKTILLNSHLLSEVETVCDSAAIINRGRIIKYGNMGELLGGDTILEIHLNEINDNILNALFKIDENLSISENIITMEIADREKVNDIVRIILENGGKLYGIMPHKKSLEDIFIGLVEEEI